MLIPLQQKRGGKVNTLSDGSSIFQKEYRFFKKFSFFFEKPLDSPENSGYNIARVKDTQKEKRKSPEEPEIPK